MTEGELISKRAREIIASFPPMTDDQAEAAARVMSQAGRKLAEMRRATPVRQAA